MMQCVLCRLALTYGSKTWTLPTRDIDKLKAAHRTVYKERHFLWLPRETNNSFAKSTFGWVTLDSTFT